MVRLPRARGDRPSFAACTMSRASAPPRTRGSASSTLMSIVPIDGSPAHAGIGRTKRTDDALSRRLPRARGDRPHLPSELHRCYLAPPRTRGSARFRIRRPHGGGGSPAHAGIGPASSRSGSGFWRLPRARGDRPMTRGSRLTDSAAPPRTRGSALRQREEPHLGKGSPAHAGIGRTACAWAPCATWLPRARGDRPHSRVDCGQALRVPRARGDRPLTQSWHGGCATAPPRTRGSARRRPRRDARAGGSPAHAGIGRARRKKRPVSRRLPRARGDRPAPVWRALAWFTAPPRTRGSAIVGIQQTGKSTGSPAHAGIGPSRESSFQRSPGLPRARGDRPAS